jgi:hypothetical protein
MADVKIIRWQIDENDPSYIWGKVATLHENTAWAATGRIQTDDIVQYVADNEEQVRQYILNNGAVDERLTERLRVIQAKRLLAESPLSGRTPEEVQRYIEDRVTDLQGARETMGQMGYQIALIYQALGLTLKAVD